MPGLKRTSGGDWRTASASAGCADRSAAPVASITSYTWALSMRRMVS